MTARARRPRPRPTWEQPRQSVMRRWRENAVGWAELECGHVTPADDLPMATAMRCRDCNPVRVRPPQASPVHLGGVG